MLPQPLGSLLDLVMDDKGRIINQSLANQKVGMVDIGFRTSDFTVMDHLRYIDRLWADDWDIDTILLTGGGCRELAQHLQPQITGNVMPIDPDIDLRLKNVMGYVKYGHYVWGHKAEEVVETADPVHQPGPSKIYHHKPIGDASGDIAAVPA